MTVAITIDGDLISDSPGRASELLLIQDDEFIRIPCNGKIPMLLQIHHADVLICNGIGNCMFDLLNTMGINVIPGISGSADSAADSFRKGSLVPGEVYSCSDLGQTCGACSGCF